MNAARRSLRRRDWPPYLYEPRPGYYTWRDPRTGESHALGYIPFAAARHQALQANAHIAGQAPTLLDRLTGATNTVEKLLEQMPQAAKANTIKTQRSQDKAIRAALGTIACRDLTVANCAELIEGIAAAGKARSAQALRSRLMAVCQRGQELGWMDSNPAAVTRSPRVVVKRRRLTLDEFRAVLARAPEVAEWLPLAMLLAIVSAQDRSTIAAWPRRAPVDGCAIVQRPKTEHHASARPVAIPLALRLDVIGVSLGELLARRSGVLSPFVLHHVKAWGNAPAGSPIAVDRISHAFTEARELAGVTGDDAPTFHEIRSLSVRLYKAQGNVDTKALAGHTQEKTHALYQDDRTLEPVKVRIG